MLDIKKFNWLIYRVKQLKIRRAQENRFCWEAIGEGIWSDSCYGITLKIDGPSLDSKDKVMEDWKNFCEFNGIKKWNLMNPQIWFKCLKCLTIFQDYNIYETPDGFESRCPHCRSLKWEYWEGS